MKSVFGFRVRLGNPDLDFQNLNPDFPIERTLSPRAERHVACMYDVLHVATNIRELPKQKPLMLSRFTIYVNWRVYMCDSIGCGYNSGTLKCMMLS